jgi:guanine deaminase
MHRQFLQQTIALAAENVATGQGGPFAALIVKNGEIIAQGVNCVTALHDPTAHAEVLAIRQACKKLADFQLLGCTLYSSCEPCPMCLGAIYWARVAQVFFACSRTDAAAAGFDDSFIYEQINLVPSLRTLHIQAVAVENPQLPFQLWQQQAGKIVY